MSPADQPRRENNFDFLRFFLATAVIFSHSFALLDQAPHEWLFAATHKQIESGSLAVNAFFTISGFLIAQSYLHSRSAWQFLFKRVLRIYPAFIAAALVCLFIFGPLGMRFSPDYWKYVEFWPFAHRLPGLQTLWVPPSFQMNHFPYVNSAVWTIQYEFLCYLAVMALGLAGLLKRRWCVLALFALSYVWYMLSNYFNVWAYNWQELPVGGAPDYYPRFLTYFFAGTVYLAFRDHLRLNLWGTLATLALTIVATLFGNLLQAVLPFTLPLLLFSFAFAKIPALHRWGKYGDFSYGIYLYGWPVQQSIILLFHNQLSPYTLFLLSAPAAIALGILSWFAVERPFLRFKRTPKPIATPSTTPTPAALEPVA